MVGLTLEAGVLRDELAPELLEARDSTVPLRASRGMSVKEGGEREGTRECEGAEEVVVVKLVLEMARWWRRDGVGTISIEGVVCRVTTPALGAGFRSSRCERRYVLSYVAMAC